MLLSLFEESQGQTPAASTAGKGDDNLDDLFDDDGDEGEDYAEPEEEEEENEELAVQSAGVESELNKSKEDLEGEIGSFNIFYFSPAF